MSSSSSLALLLSVATVGVYGYATYYMNYNPNQKQMHKIMPEPLRPYGHLKYLTYQCLIIQLINAILHLGAHFSRALQKPRDLVFTCLAYPVGSVVVYTFWAVWHLVGREQIFPVALSPYYPDWLNHVTHTIIVPANILMAVLVNHKYSRNAALLTLIYFGLYTVWLYYLKFKTGLFVYKYLESMNDNERNIYFAATGLIAYVMYKSGQFLSSLFHKPAQAPKKTKKN